MKHKTTWLLVSSLIAAALLISSCGVAVTEGEGALLKEEAIPLNISSPPFGEVNKPISFLVTSEGIPIEDAVLSFAGYSKKTDTAALTHPMDHDWG